MKQGNQFYLEIQLLDEKNEILDMGRLPFYGTSMSHIASQRVAYNAGFYPAWAELYCEKVI